MKVGSKRQFSLYLLSSLLLAFSFAICTCKIQYSATALKEQYLCPVLEKGGAGGGGGGRLVSLCPPDLANPILTLPWPQQWPCNRGTPPTGHLWQIVNMTPASLRHAHAPWPTSVFISSASVWTRKHETQPRVWLTEMSVKTNNSQIPRAHSGKPGGGGRGKNQ